MEKHLDAIKHKHIIILFIVMLKSVFSFGQKADSLAVVDIASGKIVKKIFNKKIESFDVEMYAVNYGNVLTFSKVNDTIFIKNADESNAIIKVFIKNNKEARELVYKKKQLLYVASIDFDLKKLPPSSFITSQLSNNVIETYMVKSAVESIADDDERDFEKSFKLFGRLKRTEKLSSIDLIFNSFADFFSEEDALFKVYSSRYAEQYAKDYDEKHKNEIVPLALADIQTDDLGGIKRGIIWNKKDETSGTYTIYHENKIIKSEDKSLQVFQNIFKEYSESIYSH